MATTIKNIMVCDVPHHAGFTESYYFTLENYWVNWLAFVVGGLPVGITAITNSLGGVIGFTVDENLVSGNTTVTIEGQTDVGGSLGNFDINFSKGICVSEIEVCCEDGETIKWLGREGGIMQWVFSGVREFEIRVGDALTFKNGNNQIQYSQRKGIHSGTRSTSGDVTQIQSIFIKGATLSIQAWQYSGENYPILIDNDSFKLFKSTDKFFDVSVQYIGADEVQIQTQ